MSEVPLYRNLRKGPATSKRLKTSEMGYEEPEGRSKATWKREF